MTESFLWLVNHSGDTFSLGTSRRHFKQLVCTHEDVITIKRVASSHWCAWAVGHDHRPYLYVFSSDVPIRIPETTYENQRWGPFHGFSKKSMIRSDRYAWSDETGTVERPKESVRLPSSHWEWDGEWMIDDNLRGEVVELGGWQYALDFPAVYSPEQHWNSFVRRRKWIHFRKFFATDCWANISDMEMVENSECIIDISVGGFLLPSQPEGFLAVWAVMNSGNVYVRTNVHRKNPEGDAWRIVSLEKYHGIINISVGATNLIWAITWDGQSLVRTKVSRNNIFGSSWVTVASPDSSTQLMQVAVGRNAVWALSRDNKVWFRKGTWGDHSFWSKESAVGSLWVEMIGEMSQITLSSNDQVFAIDTAGQNVYFRTGVSSQDLTGKTWQKVTLREDLSPFKDLGLLVGEEEFCDMDGSRRAPSESTSCSSVSLSTATSSSANLNDDVSSNGDVFLSPLSPSQPPPDFSRMLSMDDLFPPAWSQGEGEDDEPDTPTATDIPTTQVSEAAQSVGHQESQSGFPMFPTVETLEESDAELSNKAEKPRIRSVSQYSLTDSLPLSSRTISPASSIGTLQQGFTRSVSSQTCGNSIELSVDQGLSLQTNTQQEFIIEADAIPQCSRSTKEYYQSSTDKSEEQENLSSYNNGLDVRGSDKAELTQTDKQDSGASNIVDSNSDKSFPIETNSDLTEVDRHFKTLEVDSDSNEENSQNTQRHNVLEASVVSNDERAHHTQGLDVVDLPNVTASNEEPTSLPNVADVLKSNEAESKSSNIIPNSVYIQSNENKAAFQPQPVIEESNILKIESTPNSVKNVSIPVAPLSSITDEELAKKRSKSHRRPSSSRKSDPPDEPDSIVFKGPRKKKDKNRKKSKDIGLAETTSSGPVSLSAPTEGPVSSSQTEVEKDQVKSGVKMHKLESSIKHEEKPNENVDPQSFPTTLNDVAPSSLQSLSSSMLKSSVEPVGSLENENEIENQETKAILFKPALRIEMKKSGSNGDSQKPSIQHGDHNIVRSDVKQEVNNCDKHESNELNGNAQTKSEVNISETLEQVAQGKHEIVKPIDSSVKTSKPISVSVACQTDDLKVKLRIKKSPKHTKRRLAQEIKSTSFCPMTKLLPSVKKQVVTPVSKIEKEDDRTKSSDSESDEIADFVTDLISDDSDTEEHQEKKVENDQPDGEDRGVESVENRGKEEVKVSETSDTPSTLSLDLGRAEQGTRASSVTSTTSASSSVASRKMSGSVRNSPALPSSLQLKQSALYRQTPSPARLSSPSNYDFGQMPETLPPLTMVAAQPRLCWRWLDATSCSIDDPNRVDWLSSREDASHEPKVKISKHLREKLIQKIVARNKREAVGFTSFETAVEKSTWVQKATMQMLYYGRTSRWTGCSVELEQGIGGSEKGTLTVHYTYHRKQRHTQLQLLDMICVKMNTDPDLTTAFSVFTPALNLSHQPLMLKASSEKEAADWLDYLSSARASAWNLNRPVPASAIWSCSFSGDVLVSCDAQDSGKPYVRSWGLHGGHMALIETSPTGVTWGLGFDKMPHVYNGGYGGAVCTGQSHMSDNTQQMVDSHRVYVYENQKWFPVVGWCNKGVFHHNFHWVTSSGQFVTSRDQVKLPSSKWNWTSDWTIDFSVAGGVDSNGWQYSNVYNRSFHRSSHIRDQYRRRRWIRRCRISLMGPWISAGSLGLSDLSIQIDSVETPSDPIVMWAVATNGDVLCRYGVTQSNPMGQSWVHISRDQDKPFTSISVGSRGQVWGVATDGSAWYRTGVNADNPVGKNWLQVVPPPPGSFHLRQVSAGALAVWAVDTGDNLWRRENITPTFPEGTGWESIASKVKRVSVGPHDQVWIVADAYFQKSRHAPGVIYYRQGMCDRHPGGTGWQRVIGSGWAHVSVRGLALNLGNADSESGHVDCYSPSPILDIDKNTISNVNALPTLPDGSWNARIYI